MRQHDRQKNTDIPGSSAAYASTLRGALAAVIEVPLSLRTLQEETAAGNSAVIHASDGSAMLKRDALQAGAAHRNRVRARLLALEAAEPAPALVEVHAAAVAVVRDELPRLAALEALVAAEATGDPAQTRQAIQAVRDAQAISDADRERLRAAFHALSGAQPALFSALDLPSRVRAALDIHADAAGT